MLDQSIVKLCLIVHLIAAWIAIYRILSDDFFSERPLLNAKRGFLAMPGRGQLKKMPKRNKKGEQQEKNKVKIQSSANNKVSNVYLSPKEYSSLVSIYLKTIFL